MHKEADQVFLNPHTLGGLVLIEANVVSIVDKYRQDQSSKYEAGGILLGYRRGIHIHVSVATEPSIADKRTRFSFLRKDPYHQEYAHHLWKTSDERIGYLGEWHTHPEPNPEPSYVDTNDWLRIASEQRCLCVFIIGSCSGANNFHLSCVFDGQVRACVLAQ